MLLNTLMSFIITHSRLADKTSAAFGMSCVTSEHPKSQGTCDCCVLYETNAS